MDDGYKEFRKGKPQQRIYKPGSGPLRRSGYGLDGKMDNCNIDTMGRGQERSHYGSHNSINEEATSKDRFVTNSRYKKPEQQIYMPRSGDASVDIDKHSQSSGRCDNSSQYSNRRNNVSNKDKHGMNNAGSYRNGSRKDRSFAEYRKKDDSNSDVNYNRNFRQVSETRSISPTHSQAASESYIERNRDSRSMETSAGRHMFGSSGKPPSGRRNSAGYPTDQPRPKYMVNLDNIPPRFRKKYLEQSGHHSFENVDHISRDNGPGSPSHSNHGPFYNNSNTGWSQTLPSRGRGRLKDNEGFDRDKFVNSYLRNYDMQNSRRSTPSNSYMNLYESTAAEARSISEKMNNLTMNAEDTKDHHDSETKNGLSNSNSDLSCSKGNTSKHENESDSETNSHISSSYMDIKNLDWTEEVEKNIKLDDLCDSSISFSLSKSSVSQPPQPEIKPAEPKEGGSSKRRGRSKRRDKRSRSRGQVNTEKKPERTRRDSNVSVQQDPMPNISKQRERRDSHRSNRSSNLGNSRDDLSNWRSLRSYSREHSNERRIVSQCNSRDPSINRATSPRDNDGFRIPSKPANWAASQPHPKKNGAWSGCGPSSDRGRVSPAPIPEAAPEPAPERPKRSGRKRSGRRKGRHSDIPQPFPQAPGAAPAPTNMNWRDEIIEAKKHAHDKPDPHYERSRLSSTRSEKSISDVTTSQPGVIVLPQGALPPHHREMEKSITRGNSIENQKLLYDHHNPSKPIIVQTSPSKIDMRMEHVGPKEGSFTSSATMLDSNMASRAARHRSLLQQVDRADAILQTHMLQGATQLANHWNDIRDTRKLLQNALHKLLMSDLKYCQADNIEHHFWKILYYNFIEVLRKSITQMTPEDKPKIVKLLNVILDEGTVYFENLVQMLENMYKFSTDDYINDNHLVPPKGLGYVGLALISVQKLYVFLGDLARYKEQVNETNNYAKSKSWYTKAQQINPKNGRPYNQLAILAIYARRKLDAVYYYMRSLMSSNPFQSARESLLSLFDENSKKFEAAERKRRAALESAKPENGEATVSGHGFRREIWIRPSGHKTTTLCHDTRDEHLNSMSSVELNKNFITSYLHVHGKLITRIGMESFHSRASCMLRQFRSLLHRQPLPTPAARLLQLTALNMFAVETNTNTDPAAPRSPWLDCALGVSLLMWGLVVERCCALLPEPEDTQQHADARLLLPAVKVWSDWMLCHSSVWNPPPSFDAFDLQTENDPWDWLAKLMNILETLDDKSIDLENESKEGCTAIRLPEDSSLAGFTPLMYMEPAVAWLKSESALAHSHNIAEHALRTRKLLFFGTEYLVGVEPPVLKMEYPANASPRYVSAVQRIQKTPPPLQHLSEDSEEESESVNGPMNGSTEGSSIDGADETTRRLLRRKEMLESRKATMEQRRQRMQEILRGGWVSVEVVVRPRWLVPDTNCFVDHLPLLKTSVQSPAQYLLAIPLIVVSELEGLRKCSRVGECARAALSWIYSSGGNVRLATSRGTLLASRAFTAESDDTKGTNDDKILATAVNLHQNVTSEPDSHPAPPDSKTVRRVREVVLLTDDRNLRVKALAAELPARDLPSFMHWAALAQTEPGAPEASGANK